MTLTTMPSARPSTSSEGDAQLPSSPGEIYVHEALRP